jgi:glycerol-3-phosphate acyltransferase PlsY
MTDALVAVSAAAAAYLIGSIPTGYLIAKAFRGIDIRKFGSSNVGATNVYRVTGKFPGFLTLLLDILKGAAAVTILAEFSYSYTSGLDHEFFRSLLGLTVICGHVWSVFMRFKGGKGVATTIGVMAAISPLALSLSLAVWVTFFAATNYVSVGSLAFGIALPIFTTLSGRSFYVTMLAVTICALNTYKHRSNIKRLLNKEESRTFIFKSKKNPGFPAV